MTVTPEDEKLIREIAKFPTLKEASKNLNIPYSTLTSKSQRWRNNQVKYREYINKMLGFRRSSKLLAKILRPHRIVQIKEDDEE